MITDAKTIIDKSSTILNDMGSDRWSTTELLGWLNDGQLAIVNVVPNASSVTENLILAAGSKQIAPTSTIRIIEFVRNRGTNGTDNGDAIRAVNRKVLDNFLPGWGTVTASNPASATVKNVMYDPDDDINTFYVWPPQPSSGFGIIEIIRSIIPTLVSNANVGTKITIADHYSNALIDYVVYRALIKDSDFNNIPKAGSFMQSFMQQIGQKFTGDTTAKGLS